jgi:hypothetical protein
MADTKHGNPGDRLEEEGGASSERQRIHNSPPGAGTPSGFRPSPLVSREVVPDKELAGHGSAPPRPRSDSTPSPPPGALKPPEERDR